ncbi:MAG: FAD-binding protein [Clostridia bacterium]|nr:FAD-binding protein [Clostridia bacterium]
MSSGGVRRFDGIRIPPGDGAMLDREVRIRTGGDVPYRVIRKSVDARDKARIVLVYSVETGPAPRRPGMEDRFMAPVRIGPRQAAAAGRPVVVGTGPAGMFAGLGLAVAGLRPILLEQGQPVDGRAADVARFWNGGALDPWSNVQFGEGGAGTFSDGKLTTGIRDERVSVVFEELVRAGAPEEIAYLAHPHIGTDRLHGIVRNIRVRIESLGGEYRFGHRFCGYGRKDGQVRSARAVRLEDGSGWEGDTRHIVLAIGHSARRTYADLAAAGLAMEPKPFSAGVRIEHPQTWIDTAQYGTLAGHPDLPRAEYKLSCHLGSGRAVYTFCMCPGGRVVAAASEPGRIVTNGMSIYARDGVNANSALLVSVTPADFPDASPLGGLAWQAGIEEAAFLAAGGGYRAPSRTVGSFLHTNRSASLPDFAVYPTYRPGTVDVPPEDYLPEPITAALQEALPLFGRKIRGFDHPAALLTGPETRSSSPVRILRDQRGTASVPGIYPCGEGAGYAGGIVSAAVDGIRAAEAVVAAVMAG